MSVNYNQPQTSDWVAQNVAANPSITPATQLAIAQTLGLGPGVQVIVGSVLPDGTINQPNTPGSTPEMLTFNIGLTGGIYTLPTNVQAALQKAAVVIFDTDRDVLIVIPAASSTIASNASHSFQTLADHSAQTLPANFEALANRTITQKIDGTGQTFDRVIQLGNGNDDISVLDGKSNKVVASGGNDKITIGNGDNLVTGGDGQDTILITGNGNNVIVSGWGVDTITGGKGRDVVTFTKAGTDTANPNGTGATAPGKTGGDWLVTHNSDGTLGISSSAGAANGAVLKNVEFVQFGDAAIKTQFSVAIYHNESDANVTRLFQTVLDRSADDAGSKYWVDQYNSGNSLENITKWFLSTPESTLVTSQNNTAFITQMYENAFGRAPDTAGLNFWLDALNKGVSRAVLVDYIATSTEAKTTIANVQVFTDWV